ncbi:unnamed protein product [Mycena citricolor]|uniref:WLM-domain-containing protein n=1 Tax=Mycena citricolor TaxID=2018698 RepID=A0AAD2HT98_9AGAR|nr:unnamed protein product [Mycena citricolor]
MADTYVQSFSHLKGRPKEQQALEMLKKIASLVKPIMRKHNWVLPVLCEFFPAQSNLLEDPRTFTTAHFPDTFMELEEVVGTMLHELTHNVHGPHDDKFYKFLSGLQDEYDALQRSGYAGEGFYSKGNRLGANVSHDLPPHLARTKALEAAEKRRKVTAVLGSGGRLGGGGSNSRLSPREQAARAAERRARDEKACGVGELALQEADKAAKESVVHEVIDLTEDSDDVQIVEKPRSAVSGKSATARPRPRIPIQPVLPQEWICLVCTLINAAASTHCEVCATQRPQDKSSGWSCLTCGATDMPHEFWSCRLCGSIKTTS